MIAVSMVDVVVDRVDENDEGATAKALCNLVARLGEWDWSDATSRSGERPDRGAVVESSGAWWCVCRTTEGDEAWRFATADEAYAKSEEIEEALS